MAKRKGKSRKNGGMKIPVAVIAGFFPAVSSTLTFTSQVGWKGALPHLSRIMTGYNPDDGRWYPAMMLKGVAPIVLGIGVHKLIGGRLGVNRALSAAGIPLIRL